MSRRAHISLRTYLAAALRVVGGIPYDHAKLMHEDQIISLFDFDHGILHGVEPIDDHWNLTPVFKAPHREKSRKDTSTVAKVKRLERAEALRKMAAVCRATGIDIDKVVLRPKRKAKIAARVNPWPAKGSRKIHSRNTFQRGKKADARSDR
jgi:hypothetical protein